MQLCINATFVVELKNIFFIFIHMLFGVFGFEQLEYDDDINKWLLPIMNCQKSPYRLMETCDYKKTYATNESFPMLFKPWYNQFI